MPFTLHQIGVGIVESVGDRVNDFKPGDYVIPARLGMGTWQTYILGDESNFVQLPFPSDKLEMIIRSQGIAALAVLNSNVATCYQILSNPLLKPGDVVCQSSSNGFLGKIFIQIARNLKLKTVNFVRKERYDYYFL